jgi:hypothetical protein
VKYPDVINKWNGYGVIQAKFKQKSEGAENGHSTPNIIYNILIK